VQLQTWDLNANLYDGATTAGPVPTLFSDDQQATIDALVADPAQAHKDVVKINRYKTYTECTIYYIRYTILHNTTLSLLHFFQYLCDAGGDQGGLLRQHHQKTKVQKFTN
jgi:hypothetical protein